MPVGKRYKLTGRLLAERDRLVLEVDGGGTWVIDADSGAKEFVGFRVIVDGMRAGFNVLDVITIVRA